MYPQSELRRLALHKLALCRRIAVRRDTSAAAAREATRPLVWLDRAIAFARNLRPFLSFAAVPLAFVAARGRLPRFKTLGTLLRWGPVVVGAVRGFRAMAGTGVAGPR